MSVGDVGYRAAESGPRFSAKEKNFDVNFRLSRSLSMVEYVCEQYGHELLEARDSYGHTPAHWMALNGHVKIARFLGQKRVMVDLHSNNSQGPRPIHWASRNGHVAVVDELLNVSDADVRHGDFVS